MKSRITRITAALLAAVLSLSLLAGCKPKKELTRYTTIFYDVFDTVTQVIAYCESEEEFNTQMQALHQDLIAYNQLYDIYNDYNGVVNVKTINENAGKAPVQVDDRILSMLELARQMYDLTGGKINIAMGSVLGIWHDHREAAEKDASDADNTLPTQEELEAAAQHCDINDLVIDEDAKTVYLSDPEMSLDVGSVGKGYAVEMVCRAAEARLLTKFSLTVFKTKMEDILYASGGTAQIDARIRYMIQSMTNDGVLAVDKESEDVVKLETPLSGVTDIVRQSLEILAALNRTPAVKLLGISPSGFNATGESDIRNYYDHVRSQQEKVLRDGIKKALDCIQLYLRGTIDPSVTFDFAPLGEEDRAALATLQKTKADTIAVYMDRDIISQEEARQSLASDPDSGFSDIDPAEVPQGNGMPDALPEAGEGGLMPDIDDVDKAGAVYG